MLKRDYFQLAMDRDCYRSKAWVLAAFGVVVAEPKSRSVEFLSEGARVAEQMRIKRDDRGNPYFYHPDTGDQEYFDDDVLSNTPTPVFRFKDTVTLKAGDCINLRQTVETTYGAWLFNQIICVYPFGAKIPYSANGYTIKELEKLVEARLTDDVVIDPNNPFEREPLTGDPEKAPIYASEYIKYNEAAGALTGYTQLCVPAATPFTLTTGPAVKKRRAELFEEYKDRLHDQAVQARITAELTKLDKEWIAQDPDRGFYYRDKSFDVVRKKLFLFQGSESGFDQVGDFIPTSLDEGMAPKNLPAAITAARSGSYSRGAMTALGGEQTKFLLRMFQNTAVVEEDCGATMGRPMVLSKDNLSNYVGNFVLVNQKPVLITDELGQQLLGKPIEVRSPIHCQTPGGNFCEVCVGQKIARTKEALASYASDIGSTLMLISMSAMHGKKLSTVEYKPDEIIS